MKFLALTLALLASPAVAEISCAPRDVIVTGLEQRWKESRVMIGTSNNMFVVEWFANPETGTWSVVFTTPEGEACLVGSGENYQLRTDAIGSPT